MSDDPFDCNGLSYPASVGWVLRPRNPDPSLGLELARSAKAWRASVCLIAWSWGATLRGVSSLVIPYETGQITDEACELEVQRRLRAGWGLNDA